MRGPSGSKYFQCLRCGACQFSKKAADLHWNNYCPKLRATAKESGPRWSTRRSGSGFIAEGRA